MPIKKSREEIPCPNPRNLSVCLGRLHSKKSKERGLCCYCATRTPEYYKKHAQTYKPPAEKRLGRTKTFESKGYDLSVLDKDEAKLIKLYYGLGKQEPQTLAKIAKQMGGVSRQYLSKRIKQINKKLEEAKANCI